MRTQANLKPIFLVTVDTEEEWDWSGNFPSAPFSTENIQHVPKFQAFCKSIGVAPTYFVDYAVADKQENVEILNHFFKLEECDIGAHLHPWCTPPVDEQISEYNSHAVNLSIDLYAKKMAALTDLLQRSFNAHPLSFRSGRWGINGAMMKVLAEQGYRVDSSVRPFYSEPYFSYHSAPTQPYWPAFDNVLAEDETQRDILEIPTTSGFNFPWFEKMDFVHSLLSKKPINKLRMIGILSRLGLMRKITVTPEDTSSRDLCRCIDMCVRRGDRLISLFFHSSDLMPGNTAYVQNESDEAEFYNKIQQTVQHARTAYDAEFLTVRQTYEKLKVEV